MTAIELLSGVYGAPPLPLAPVLTGARQVSPLFPGASPLSTAEPGTYSRLVMLAPPGTLERHHAMAEALIALAHDAEFLVIAPKDKGGSRLRRELEAFGCAVTETSKSHHRICVVQRPQMLVGVNEALAAGAPRYVDQICLWSQPGVFSWDRIDPGSSLLASRLPPMKGSGADLGCGIGYLGLSVLKSPTVKRLDLIDIDYRAVEAARRNVTDPRVHLHWADVTSSTPPPDKLDFVVMNPPFHAGGAEDKALGQAFIRNAAQRLRAGGTCWLVANRHLPYEAALVSAFKSVRLDQEAAGFKVYEARA